MQNSYFQPGFSSTPTTRAPVPSPYPGPYQSPPPLSPPPQSPPYAQSYGVYTHAPSPAHTAGANVHPAGSSPPSQPQHQHQHQSYPTYVRPPAATQATHGRPAPAVQPSAGSNNNSTNAPYTPVAYHAPSAVSQADPASFYGSLLDAKSEPTQLFARMCDALFFHLDQHCDVPGLRHSGAIEPAKYAWLLVRIGEKVEDALAVQGVLRSYYDFARIPYRVANDRAGNEIVVLERQGWLHLHVFEVISDPDGAFKDWTKYLTHLPLADPLTSAPLPTPFPRGCLPTLGDPAVRRAVEQWKLQAAVAIAAERKAAEVRAAQAMVAGAFAARSYGTDFSAQQPYAVAPVPASYGPAMPYGVQTHLQPPPSYPQMQYAPQPQPQPQPQVQQQPPVVVVENITNGNGSGGDSGGGHTTKLDAATAAINLTAALVTAFSGSSSSSS